MVVTLYVCYESVALRVMGTADTGGTMLPRFKLVAFGCVVVAVTTAMIGLASAGAQTTTTTTTGTPSAINFSDTGVGKPPPGAGMGTKAALENPKCNPDTIKGWGTFPFVTTTYGPVCVAPAPKSNGGATAPGVTATSIKVVVATPNAQELATASVKPTNGATGQTGTTKDAFLDEWAPYATFFENWGRKVDFVFIESTGDDEASQRADAVKVKAEKPFAFIDGTPNGLGVLQTSTAQAKIVTFGNNQVSNKDSIAQAPYRWAEIDSEAAAILSGQWAGKQLTKRKAQWAGDSSLQSKVRTFGAVYNQNLEIGPFNAAFAKYGGKLAVPAFKYSGAGGFLGDTVTAQQQAPTIISRLKDAGVTSVFLFSDSAMNAALTSTAAKQDYSPEWLLTSTQYADLVLLARQYDQTQWDHAFGISALGPWVVGAPSPTPAAAWYWGADTATTSNFAAAGDLWLAKGIMYAGPDLTAAHLQQGMFAVPAYNNVAYGKTAGLPYDEYGAQGTYVGLGWYDSKTTGSSQISPGKGKGVMWYVGGTQAYQSGQFPAKTAKFFDPASSEWGYDSPPTPLSPTVPCKNCPSQGGPGDPAAKSGS